MDKKGTISNPIFWLTAIIFIISVVSTIMIYFYRFDNLSYSEIGFMKLSNSFFMLSGSSFLLYLTFSKKVNSKIFLKPIFFIGYLVCSVFTIYLSFKFGLINFKNVSQFEYIVAIIFCCTSILIAIAYPITFIFIFSKTFKKINNNEPLYVIIMIFLPIIFLIVSILIAIIVVITLLTFGAPLFLLGLKKDKHSSSNKSKYTFVNSMGCEETVYSENGKDFYDCNNAYRGHSEDNGETIIED